MAEFDYAGFARAYLGLWSDPHVSKVLKKLYDPGFEYEDSVKLSFKGLLSKISNVTRVSPNTFAIEFSDVDVRLNSDCLPAVVDYLRVFMCERGHADSYESSIDLLGDVGTGFSGLIKQRGESDSQMDEKYKAAYVSLAEGENLEQRMQECRDIFDALMAEIAKKRPVVKKPLPEGDGGRTGRRV